MPVSGPESEILELLPAYEKINEVYISLITKYSEYQPTSNKLNIYTIHKFKNSKLNTIYFFVKSIFKIVKIHKRKPIHVINLHSFHYNLIVPLLVHFFFKIPILITTPMDFETAYKEEWSKSQSILLKIAFYGWMKFFKSIIVGRERIYIQAINDKIYNDIFSLSNSKKNVVKIPNGICSKNYLGLKKHERIETHFAYIGRLIKSKNLRFLIKTFSKYLSIYPSDKLYIYGEGSEENFLLKYIKEKKLSKNIVLCGFEKDKRKIYSKIDVLVHPSFGEGIPMNILEAILTDTFVIASNVSGNRDIIEHEISGLLFDPYKESDLLNQLLFFKEHPNLVSVINKKARNKILTHYDIDVVAKKVNQFLKLKLKSSMDKDEKEFKEIINELYIKEGYIAKNPLLHEVDSRWKIRKIIPLIDNIIGCINKEEINLLDVGGGAGVILKEVSIYIEQKHGLKVNKFALDLSSEILVIQQKRNPDLKKALNEDICNTSLGDKEIDITLMIDVLEHIPNLKTTLEELNRISNYIIFKVPLEENLLYKMLNIVKRGKIRQFSAENMGHINFFNYKCLKQHIEGNLGVILSYYYTNVFEFLLNSSYYQKEMSLSEKIINFISLNIFRISPKLASLISNDFIMILSKCY